MSDVSVPEQLGRVVGRHLPLAGLSAGLALVIAAVGMLGMFIWAGFVPVEHANLGPIGEVCTTTGQCFEVDSEAVEQRLEDDLNRSNRIIGSLGVAASVVALLLGWRLWRSSRWRHDGAVARGRVAIVTTCLVPVAAVLVVTVTGIVYWASSGLFE